MTWPPEQVTPRQSHGADGVELFQPESALSGSLRLSLKSTSASISGDVSDERSAYVSRLTVEEKRMRRKVTTAMNGGE